MTMRLRMLLVSVTVLALITALGVMAWVAISDVERMSANAEAITEVHEIAAAIDGDLQELATALDGYAISGDTELTTAVEASLDGLDEELIELDEELPSELRVMLDSDLDALTIGIRRLGGEIRTLAAAPPSDVGASAGELFAELAELQGESHEFYEESEHWTAEALGAQASVVSRLTTELVLIGVAVLGVVAVAWLLVSRSLRRIDSMTETAIAIAGGDLGRHVDESRQDEIGALAGAFNSMTGQLRGLINNLEARVAERTSALSEANAALSQEVAERERAEVELERYATRLEQSNRALQEFAYVASHDLQEPLRKIRSFGDRLQTGYREEVDERGQDYLDRIQNAATRMQALIEGLLAYSRVTSRTDAFETVDLNTIADGVVSDLEVRLHETGGVVTIDDLPTIDADPVQMRQLLQNLIANALKFSQPGRKPLVTVSAGRSEGSNGDGPTWTLTVADNGIGFEQKYAERIFGVFQRLHGRGVYAGTGIGLASCAKIAERHGGSIEARGLLDEGATFIVRLPSRQATRAEETEWKVPARSVS
jgi:signal transduction histidine kinase